MPAKKTEPKKNKRETKVAEKAKAKKTKEPKSAPKGKVLFHARPRGNRIDSN